VDPNLQVSAELAEDVIGAYIGRVSALLSRAAPGSGRQFDIQQLAANVWLQGELFIAAADRARLFERDREDLEAIVHLYRSRLIALSNAVENARGLFPGANHQTLPPVLDEIAKQNG
jgi:hypothetical protein